MRALIEFVNRAVSGIVGIITVLAAAPARTRRPFRRDLFALALALPLGVLVGVTHDEACSLALTGTAARGLIRQIAATRPPACTCSRSGPDRSGRER
jgi:hypothetical protein